jgi:hypothetical protein
MEAEALLRSAGRKVPGGGASAAVAAAEAGASGDQDEVVTDVLRIEPIGQQLAKLVWLHGGGLHSLVQADYSGDVPEGWASLASRLDMPWCKLLVPQAQVRRLKFVGDLLRPSWFDVEMDGLMHDVSPLRVGSENLTQLRLSARVIADLVATEKELCTDPVVLGGFGPGAAVALWALLSVKHSGARPDALILSNCWAPPGLMRPKNMEALKGLPILQVAVPHMTCMYSPPPVTCIVSSSAYDMLGCRYCSSLPAETPSCQFTFRSSVPTPCAAWYIVFMYICMYLRVCVCVCVCVRFVCVRI